MTYTIQSGEQGGVVLYGDAPNVPLEDGDRSLHWRGAFGTVEDPGHPLYRCGRLRIELLDVGGGDFRFAAVKSFAGGSITAIGTTEVAEDTEYRVLATWDRATATVAIIVDGTTEDTAEDAASYVNTPNLPTYSIALPPNSWCTECAAWASVVDLGGGLTEFFGGIEMLREFWVEDPAGGSYPWNDNGTLERSVAMVGGTVTIAPTAINGKPAWDFTGDSSMCLRNQYGDSGTEFTVFHVIKMNSTGAGDTIGDAGTQNDAYVSEEGGQWRAYNRTTTDVSGGTSDLNPHILMVHFKTNDTKIYVDGTVVATDSSCTTGAATGFAIGGNYAGTDSFNGYTAYAGMYQGDLAAHPDYAEWLALVKDYYGIS